MNIGFDLERKTDINDLNNDGIPDGAEMSMAHETMGEDGSRKKISARWTKGAGQSPPGIAAPAGNVPPAGLAQGNPGTTAQEVFGKRVDRAADLYGIRRTNTDTTPVDMTSRKSFLNSQVENLGISPSQRIAARRELDDIMAEDMAAKNRQLSRDNAMTAKDGIQIEARNKLDVAEIMGRSKVEAASETADGKREAAGTVAEQKDRQFAEKMKLERDKLKSMEDRETTRMEMWKSRDSDKAILKAAKDEKSLQTEAGKYLDKAFGILGDTLRDYIVKSYDPKTAKLKEGATIDPVFEDRLRDLNDKWQEAYGRPYLADGMDIGGKTNGKKPFAPPSQGGATPLQAINTQKDAAATWLKQNPNDPRSAEIRRRMGL